MLTSRAWIISSGLVGAISLMLRSALNFSVTGAHFSLPALNPLFVINGIIFVLAASASLFGHGSDSPATEHHHDDSTYHYEHDHHSHDHNHNSGHDHDHDRSSKNSSNSSFDQYNNNNFHEEVKFPVRPDRGVRRPVSSPAVHFPSTAPDKAARLRRSPIAPLKTFPQDDKSGDENETMEEMWNRVKAEKQPTKPNIIYKNDSRMSTSSSGHAISRNGSRMSTSSCPSPSRARRPPPSPAAARGKSKLMTTAERIPSWAKLKKELSMGRDELNSRVEAFIRKFNDEMKLQRLESITRRYKLFRRRSEEK